MNKLFLFIILILSTAAMSAQDVVFKVEITADTLYYGNTLGIKFTVENAQGDFEPPEFDGFDVVGGPNVSSQFSMVNGAVSQSASYEYFLNPKETGTRTIDAASLKQGESILYSEQIVISVVDNPDGIRQNYRSYGITKEAIHLKSKEPLSKADSLKLKLSRIKARKI